MSSIPRVLTGVMDNIPEVSRYADYGSDAIKDHDSSSWSIARRISSICVVPFQVIAAALDAVIGVQFAALSIVAFGQSPKINDKTYRHIQQVMSLPSRLLSSSVRILNPNAEFPDPLKPRGIVTEILLGRLDTKHWFLSTSENLIVSFFGSRFITLLKIPTAIVSRVMDFAIGIFATFACIITAGCFEQVNTLASRQLQILQIIPDIYRSAIELLNSQGFAY